MAKKTKQPQRGATPLPTKKPVREWRVRLPRLAVPTAVWGWLLSVSLVAAASYGGHQLYSSWPVKEIKVEGRLQAWSAAELIQQLDWVKQESFFSLDVEQVRQELQSLPLLHQVKVQKRWPGIVIIAATEDVPVALWNEQQLLSASGVISEIPAGLETAHLIRMQGPQRQVTQAAHYFRRIQQAVGTAGVRVSSLTMSSVESVQVELSNGWTVEFGRQYFEERILRLKKLIEYFPAEKISTIDLRYGKGVAIRWRPQQEIG